MNNYLENIYNELLKLGYKVNMLSSHKHIELQYDSRDLLIYDNSYAILLIEKLKCLHHIPIMLSSTDTFFINYIKDFYPLLNTKKGQLSIFDFI